MRRTLTLTLILALAMFAVACSGDDSESATTTEADQPAGTEASITISGFAFTGAETASVGDIITVTNEDAVGHTWTAVDGEFDSGTLGQDETFEFTFDEAGEFDYFCSIHPEMTGTVTVGA